MEKQFIETSGDLIHLYEVKLKKTITTASLLDSIANNRDITTPVLPTGCKVYSVNPAQQVVRIMMERVPKMTTVTFIRNKYLIALPFIQFYMTFTTGGLKPAFLELHLSCTKVPVKDLTDPIYILPLPNQFSRGDANTCTGGISLRGSTIPELASDMLNQYFGAPFNNDLNMDYPAPLNGTEHERCIKKWQELSTNNVLLGVSDAFEYKTHARRTVGGRISRD